MQEPVTGQVHGRTVTLDRDVPDLDGQRVRVVLEPLGDTDLALDADVQAQLWNEWVRQGPQGPMIDEDDGFP